MADYFSIKKGEMVVGQKFKILLVMPLVMLVTASCATLTDLKAELTAVVPTYKKINEILMGDIIEQPRLVNSPTWEYFQSNLRIALPMGWEFIRVRHSDKDDDKSVNTSELKLTKYMGESIELAWVYCGIDKRTDPIDPTNSFDPTDPTVSIESIRETNLTNLTNAVNSIDPTNLSVFDIYKQVLDFMVANGKSFDWRVAYQLDSPNIDNLAAQFKAIYLMQLKPDQSIKVVTNKAGDFDSYRLTTYDKFANINAISYGAVIDDSLLYCHYADRTMGLHYSVEEFNAFIATLEYVKG